MEIKNILSIAASLDHIAAPFRIHNPSHPSTVRKVAGIALFIFASFTIIWGTILLATAFWKYKKIREIAAQENKPEGNHLIKPHKKWVEATSSTPSSEIVQKFMKDQGIVGIEKQACALRDAVIAGSRGFLFHGPQGTGKSLLAKHAGKLLGCEPERIAHFSIVKIPILGTEEGIHLFKHPSRFISKQAKKGQLSVLIIDNVDLLFPKWKKPLSPQHQNVLKELTKKIDQIKKSQDLVIIGTAHRKSLVDPIVLESELFQVSISFDEFDKQSRLKLLEAPAKKLIQKGLLGENVNLNILAELTDHFSARDIKYLFDRAQFIAMEKNPSNAVTMEDFLSAIKELGESPSIGLKK